MSGLRLLRSLLKMRAAGECSRSLKAVALALAASSASAQKKSRDYLSFMLGQNS